MKRRISLTVVLVMVIFLIAGCAQDMHRNSEEPAEISESSIEQSEREEQPNDEYEDELFAEAAQFLNNKDYVSAHAVAEKSTSGKCKDAVEYAIADAFSREMLYGANVISEVLNTIAADAQSGATTDGTATETLTTMAENISELIAKRIEPLYRITSEIPKDTLPSEVHTNYDSYLQMLDLGKQMLSTLPECWNDSGEETEYMTEWESISAAYNEMITPTLDTTQYLDGGYVLPAEYHELLDETAFFNYGSGTSALKIDNNNSQAAEYDFRNIVWGMSQDEVKRSETVELVDVNGVLGSGEFSSWEDDIIQQELDGSTEAMRQYVSGLREKLQRLKETVVTGCKNAFSAFREKGNAALAHLSRFFKVQPILEGIRSDAEKASKTAEQAIRAVEAAGARYHEAGRNLRNAGRALAGKSGIVEAKPNGKVVQGIAAPLRAARSCFKGIVKHTETALQRLKQLEEKAAKPPRIKKILRECGKQVERENRSKRERKEKNIAHER